MPKGNPANFLQNQRLRSLFASFYGRKGKVNSIELVEFSFANQAKIWLDPDVPMVRDTIVTIVGSLHHHSVRSVFLDHT